MRGRAANPRWIAGVMRHGYKGAAEIAATVDYLFAFAATARAVDDFAFRGALTTPISATMRCAVSWKRTIPAALAETRSRFREAIERGLWRTEAQQRARQLLTVIPANAGIQGTEVQSLALDPRLREGDANG